MKRTRLVGVPKVGIQDGGSASDRAVEEDEPSGVVHLFQEAHQAPGFRSESPLKEEGKAGKGKERKGRKAKRNGKQKERKGRGRMESI